MTTSVGPARCRPRDERRTTSATRRDALLPLRNTRDTGGQLRARNLRFGRPPHTGGSMFHRPDEDAAYIRDNDVVFVDVRFCEQPGVMQHFDLAASTVGEEPFSEG